MKYQFYAIIFDVAGNQVNCKTSTEPATILTAPQLSTALTIEPSANKTVKIGDTFTIKATLSPDNVTNNKVNWTSSDSSKATVSTNETTSGTSITVTAKKTGTVTITATPADGQAQHAKSITVTINPLTIADISPQYYGDYMDYPVDNGVLSQVDVSEGKATEAAASANALIDGTVPKTDWRVFYKDDTYTYLIASDYIPTSKFPDGVFTVTNGSYSGYWSSTPAGTTPTWEYKDRFLFDGLKSVNSSNTNYKAASYLLNVDFWSDFTNSTYANATIGGPTIEMFCASWNAETPDELVYFGVNSAGYVVGKSSSSLREYLAISDYKGFNNTLYFPHNKPRNTSTWNNCHGYWLASPTSYRDGLIKIHCAGSISTDYITCSGSSSTYQGIRPVVMLKSTLLAEKHDVDGIWEIKGNSLALDVTEDQVKTPWHSFTVTPIVHDSIEDKQVNWYSSNPSVATVSATTTESGTEVTIKSIAEGEAIITAALASDNKQTESFKVTVVPPRYEYGDYVDYPVDLGIANNTEHTLVDGSVPKTNWRIFDDDGKYIYLIASDYIPTSKFPSGVFENNDGQYCGWWSSLPLGTTPTWEYKDKFLFNGLTSVNSSNANYKATTYLLNTNLWTNMIDSTYADVAIGSPTLEMMCASWNMSTPNEQIHFGVDGTGYSVGKSNSSLSSFVSVSDYKGFGNTLYYPHNKLGNLSVWNNCMGCWISSASVGNIDYVMIMSFDGSFGNYSRDYKDNHFGIRPVVCLKSTTELAKDANGIWQLSN